ncbi:conserved membrane protein of unknown function [Tenacibaculum sp. 190130A14a]|uniref:Yip1 domain-containing protein n=1 Tax=Tenacibaculum polynesiense TaxID=3137857 RepID=A0ABP1EXQ3_9FLAO
MKTLLLLIFSPKKGALNFQNRFRDDLYKEGMFLAFLYGIVHALRPLEIFNNQDHLMFPRALGKIWEICLYLLTFMVLSFIIYKIGQFFKGNANYKETFALLMYTYFPIFCCGLFLDFLNNPYLYNFEFNTNLFKASIFILSWLLSIRALLIGIKKIYDLNLKKAFITILPILIPLLGVVTMSIYLHELYF